MTTNTNTNTTQPYNWREYSNTIHHHFMHQMGITLNSAQEIGFLGLELGGECGELLNEIKKVWRDGITQQRKINIEKEVADTMIMLWHICEYFGIDAEAVASAKIQELYTRWPDIKQVATRSRYE